MQPELVRTCRARGPKTPDSAPALPGVPWAVGGAQGAPQVGEEAEADPGRGVGQVLISRPCGAAGPSGAEASAFQGREGCLLGFVFLSQMGRRGLLRGRVCSCSDVSSRVLPREWGRPPSEEGLPGTQSLPTGTAAAGKLFSGVLSGRRAAASGQASPLCVHTREVSAPCVECFHKGR